MESTPEGLAVTVGQGRLAVRLDLRSLGHDWILVISGGAAHVGAVALASAADPAGVDGRALAAGTHREGPLAREGAAAITRATGRNCASVAGIHQDSATPREIAQIVANVRRGVAMLTAELAAWPRCPHAKREEAPGHE